MADDNKDDAKQTIVEVARERFQKAKDANDTLRQQALEDTRFVLGDSDNNWQWPGNVYSQRARGGQEALPDGQRDRAALQPDHQQHPPEPAHGQGSAGGWPG
jgi:hypothetical protein